jgi:copper chaperone
MNRGVTFFVPQKMTPLPNLKFLVRRTLNILHCGGKKSRLKNYLIQTLRTGVICGMKSLRFKTNLKCDGCVAAVKPHLEKVPGVISWNVDLRHPDRHLTAEVASDEMKPQVEEAIRQAGYEASQLDETNDIGY